MAELEEIVRDFAWGMMAADAQKPVAVNARSGDPFQPGLGPHTESQTIDLVMAEITSFGECQYAKQIRREVPYRNAARSKCDLCIDGEWAIEVKMMRLMGDNGKPNDNILMHILSPYPAHRSAVTDCAKLLESGLGARKAILIFGYEYEGWPLEPAMSAFEALASREVALSRRYDAPVMDLVHPVHRSGRVYGWEIRRR